MLILTWFPNIDIETCDIMCARPAKLQPAIPTKPARPARPPRPVIQQPAIPVGPAILSIALANVILANRSRRLVCAAVSRTRGVFSLSPSLALSLPLSLPPKTVPSRVSLSP